MSRADVKEFGEVIDDGTAALVVVGESTIEQAVDKAALKAEKHVAKDLDVEPSDIDAAVRQAASEKS
jgi:lambda repressor-like predicted transcriptional regulator